MERVFPEALAYDVLDTLAYYKMTPEVRSLMKRFDPKDGMVLIGSDLELRLKLLAIDDKLERVLAEQDPSEPSKGFEELLDLIDALVCPCCSKSAALFSSTWDRFSLLISMIEHHKFQIFDFQRQHRDPRTG